VVEGIVLTNSSFLGFVHEHRFVVIHFWAKWNRYDDRVKTALDTLPVEIANLVAIGTFDTDPPEHWELCRGHNILNLPFLAFYRDGDLVRTLPGIRPDDVLHRIRELIDGHTS